jgi:hypothetical protein
LVCPLKNISIAKNDASVKEKDSKMIFNGLISVLNTESSNIPPPVSIKKKDKRSQEYFSVIFTDNLYLIKSFTAMYIAAKTPKRDRIIVKTGVSRTNSLSSLMPPQTVIRIITIICTPSPVYLA